MHKNYNKKSSPTWNDFSHYQNFERQFSNYHSYLGSYIDWFAAKSEFCRLAMKQGLFIGMFAGAIFCVGKFGGGYKEIETWMLAVFPSLILLISLIPDFVNDFSVLKKKANYLIFMLFFSPITLDLLQQSWEVIVIPLIGVGLGLSIIFYMINRLEGYTRAWSRYRTAQYKAVLIQTQFLSGMLDEKQAMRRLHNVIEMEAESRHKEIISDLHFFGDKVNGLVSKRPGF